MNLPLRVTSFALEEFGEIRVSEVMARDLVSVEPEAPILEAPPAYRRAFCRVCGSAAPLVYPEIGGVGIPLGALDDESGLVLSHHAFVDQKAPWLPIGDRLPQHRMRPPRPVHES